MAIIRPDPFQEIHLAPVGRFDMNAARWPCSVKGTPDGAGSVPTTWPR